MPHNVQSMSGNICTLHIQSIKIMVHKLLTEQHYQLDFIILALLVTIKIPYPTSQSIKTWLNCYYIVLHAGSVDAAGIKQNYSNFCLYHEHYLPQSIHKQL